MNTVRQVVAIFSKDKMINFILREDNTEFYNENIGFLDYLDPIGFGRKKIKKAWAGLQVDKQRLELYETNEIDLKRIVSSRIKRRLNLGYEPEIISPETALHNYSFGVGCSLSDGMIYLQSPVVDNYYISIFDYSSVLAKDKESAFKQILGCLGAKEVKFESVNVYNKSGAISANVPMSEVAGQVGINASFDKNGLVAKTVYVRYGKPKNLPYIPPELMRWVRLDPDLRVLERGRMDGNLLEMSVALEFKDGMGFDSGVSTKIPDLNLDLEVGSKFKSLHHSKWNFRVEFWPIDE